eukprot:3662827-Amphidinium_carterae.1
MLVLFVWEHLGKKVYFRGTCVQRFWVARLDNPRGFGADFPEIATMLGICVVVALQLQQRFSSASTA